MASDTQRKPPASRSRLKVAGLILLAVLLLTGMLLFWALGTASGTRAVFSAVSSLTGGSIQAQGVAGRLSDRVTIESLVIDNPGQTITLSEVDLSWRPAELLQRRLHVQQLQVQHLAVLLKEQEQEEEPARLPDSISSPVQLQIDSVSVASGEVGNAEATLVELNDLGFNLHFDGKHYVFNLDSFNLQSAQNAGQAKAALQGKASLSATKPYPIEARFSSNAQGRLEQQAIGAQGDLILEGSLEELMARADLAINRTQVKGHVQLRPFSEQMLGEANLAIRALNLTDFGADLPLTKLDIDLQAQADGAGKLSVKNADAGQLNRDRIPLSSLSLLFDRQAQKISFRDLRAVLGNGQQAAGSITGNGQFDDGKVDMTLRTERLNLQHIDERLRATRLSGSVALQHADGRQDVALDLSEPLDRNRITLTARAAVADNIVTVPEAALRIGKASASFSGSMQLDDAQAFQADGQLQRFRLADLGEFAELPDLLLNGSFAAQGQRAPALQGELRFELKDSRLAGHPLQGSGEARLQGNSITIPDLSLLAGANRLQVQGALSEQNSHLDFMIDAPQLQQLSPQFGGALHAKGNAAGTLETPRIQLEWQASKLRLPDDIQVGSLQGEADIHVDTSQPLSLRSIVAEMQGGALRMGEQAVKTLSAQIEFSPRANAALRLDVNATAIDLGAARIDTMTLRGDGTTASHTLQASGSGGKQQWEVQLAGGLNNLARQPRWQGRIEQLLAQGPVEARLRQPAPLLISAPDTRLENFFVDTDTGGIAVELFENNQRGLVTRGRVERLQLAQLLKFAAEEMPLRTDMVLSGTWDLNKGKTLNGNLSFQRESGDVEVLGHTAMPLGLRTLTLNAHTKGNELVLRALAEGERLGQIAVDATAQGRGRQLEFDADTRLAGTVRVAVPDIGWAGPLISPALIANGRLDSRVAIGGTIAQPQLDGHLQGNALRLFFADTGIDLRQGTLIGRFDDSSLMIESLRFASEEGHIGLSGPIVFGSAQPDVRLTLEARRYRLLNRADRRLTLSGDSRILLQQGEAAVTGRFTVDSGFFDIGQADMPSLSSDVVIVGQEEKQAASFPLALDLQVALGDGITLRGQGLDAVVVGEVRLLNGAGDTIQAQGTLSLAKGSFTAYGRELTIERGVLQFSGPVNNPALNILAMKRDQEVAAGVSIGGTVLAPRITLVSEPPLPEADKLSWLVLGRGLDAVAQGDLSVLQAAAGALLGGRESVGTQARIANAFGLDTLSLTTGGDGLQERIVTVGKQISSRLYVSYRQGLENLTSVLLLRYQLSRRVTLEAEAGSRSAFSIFYNIAFD